MFSGLRQIVWADAQTALWAVLFLVVGLLLSVTLRKGLPVWRKGIWLAAIFLPPLLVGIASVFPREAGRWVLTDWLSRSATISSSGLSSTRAYSWAAFFYLAWVTINLLIELGAALRLRRLLVN